MIQNKNKKISQIKTIFSNYNVLISFYGNARKTKT